MFGKNTNTSMDILGVKYELGPNTSMDILGVKYEFGPSVFYLFGPPDSVYRTSSFHFKTWNTNFGNKIVEDGSIFFWTWKSKTNFCCLFQNKNRSKIKEFKIFPKIVSFFAWFQLDLITKNSTNCPSSSWILWICNLGTSVRDQM